MRATVGFIVAALIGGVFSLPGISHAAPQILALVETQAPMPLICENGVCSAQFTAYCLQEHRDTPKYKAAYVPAPSTSLKLIVTDKAGHRRELPLRDRVTIRAERTFVAVSLSIPEEDIRAFGGVSAAISVGPMATLLPVPVTGDPHPQTAAELSAFIGANRKIARDVYSSRSASAELVRRTGRMINALPASGDVPEAVRRDLWSATFGAPPEAATGPGSAEARAAFEDCRRDINDYVMFGMRACLSRYHDDAMITTTKEVWKTLNTGS